MSIARGIVTAHGGQIELVTQPVGTCFRIHLPIEAEVRLAGQRVPPPAVPDDGAVRTGAASRAKPAVAATGVGTVGD